MMVLPAAVAAQVVEGTVLDMDGAPLPYASVYIESTTIGVSTDIKGRFRMEVPEGTERLVMSFVGYKPQTITLPASFETHFVSVELEVSSNEIKTAEIVGDTKDRAKAIMDQVRAARRSFRDSLKTYSSSMYTKIKLEKEFQPEIDSLPLGEEVGLAKEGIIMIESTGRVDFQRAEKYYEFIEGYRNYEEKEVYTGKSLTLQASIGPEDIAPIRRGAPNKYVLWNGLPDCDFDFYENRIDFDKISSKPILSPIAANSGLTYRYDYDGMLYEGEQLVHRIKVSPLNSSEALFEGILFIEDGTWALRGVDLELNPRGIEYCERFRIIQNYERAENGAYVPVRRVIDYSIPDGWQRIIGKVIMQQDDFVINRDFSLGHFSGEVKKFEEDAWERNPEFWTEIRPITLDTLEAKFVARADSIEEYLGSDEYFHKLDSAFNRITWWSPLVGLGHRNRVKGNEWYIEGLVSQVNPVGIGGYRHRLPGYYQHTFANDDLIEVDGFVDYGFRNKDVKGRVGLGYTYRPDKAMRTYVRVGDIYEIINDRASIEQYFSRSNYSRKQTFLISQRMELFNGFYAEARFDYADQIPLKDIAFAVWSNELFGELNQPSDFQRYTKSEVQLEVKWRINQKYVWKRGRKEVLGTDYPTLTFEYRKGIPGLFNSEVKFDFFEVGADHEMTLARFGDLHWQASMGSFFQKESLRLLEYKYFRGSDRFFFSDPSGTFQLLGPTLTTADGYFQVNAIHHFNGTILGKVPLLNRLKLELAAGGGSLVLTGEDFRHAEVFAGLERTFRIKGELFRLGVYGVTSDNNFERADYTLKVGINFFNTFTNEWEY
ncbi:DUF5686 and carboxypeptidase regulatory-like domain-containing protein [Sanyastnella coralliicola]|uniref:DUF5686 and carboxypeptidase regulatory-like domain-containing protein n=1 Tax=Sanyastnella coralliicola TaxID=3069118 RepID=UPI0027BA63BE|nr:DUF5686 and carboxypeptidase regulatory-like domain-containing protein [Longitalea sp. SCSIO 12813]